MYNSIYSCKYSLGSTDDELYREDIVNIFELAEFDENQIVETLDTIYDKFKNDKLFNEILVNFNSINQPNCFSVDDLGFVFIIMYSYDYLYLIHPCVCDLLNYGKISPEHLKLVNNTINNE